MNLEELHHQQYFSQNNKNITQMQYKLHLHHKNKLNNLKTPKQDPNSF